MKNPTGNAIIYWRVTGNTGLLGGAEIIASNFVISPLQAKNEILMVNFPPVVIESFERLVRIVEKNNLDLIKGESIHIPDNVKDFNAFYLSQLEKYNGIIRDYLIAFREKNAEESPTSLPRLISQAEDTMKGVRKLVRRSANVELISTKIDELREIQDHMNAEMKGYDLTPIISILDKPDLQIDRLVDLYKQKLLAIFLEDYEKAQDLKEEITRIERTLAT